MSVEDTDLDGTQFRDMAPKGNGGICIWAENHSFRIRWKTIGPLVPQKRKSVHLKRNFHLSPVSSPSRTFLTRTSKPKTLATDGETAAGCAEEQPVRNSRSRSRWSVETGAAQSSSSRTRNNIVEIPPMPDKTQHRYSLHHAPRKSSSG